MTQFGLHNILILLLVGLFVQTSSFSQSTKTLKRKESRLKRQINQTKALIKESEKNEKITLNQLTIINQQLSYRSQLTNNLNNQIRQIEESIEQNKSEITSLTKELAKLKTEFKEMIRFAYKQRNSDYNMMYLLSSKDINEAYKRSKYINQYAENRKIQAKEIKETQGKLTRENEELTKNKADKLLVIDEAKASSVAFEKDKAYQQKILAKIDAKQDDLIARLKKQEREKQKVAQAIKKAIEAQVKKTTKQKTGKNKTKFKESPEAKKLGKLFSQNKGKLPWPVGKGSITGRFGKRQHSVVKTVYIENSGIDISTNKNAAVKAVFNGTVSSVISIPGSGKAVIVSHGNYRTVYGNLKTVNVKTGQKVNTSQTIGSLLTNNSGSISEAHFEVWEIKNENSRAVNPALWLKRM